MPVALKSTQLKYKNPDNGAYIGVDVIAEKTTAEMVSEVESAGQAKLTEINARATEVHASLPKVSEMEDIVAVPFVQNDPYPEGAYVIHTVNGVNHLYKLPDGHTAGVAWGEFEVDGPLTFSEELNNTVRELVAVQDEQPTAPENKVWLTETPPAPIVVPTYDEYVVVENATESMRSYNGIIVDGKYADFNNGNTPDFGGLKYVEFGVSPGMKLFYKYTIARPDNRGLVFYAKTGAMCGSYQTLATPQEIITPANAVLCRATVTDKSDIIIASFSDAISGVCDDIEKQIEINTRGVVLATTENARYSGAFDDYDEACKIIRNAAGFYCAKSE